ncbi:hypothetical protein BKA83DRAFT_2032831 [Pisolithus microcarpus]|nr:hypothetical protein BKA83DRAFT_2032831 [Pisolithus microcarpus]
MCMRDAGRLRARNPKCSRSPVTSRHNRNVVYFLPHVHGPRTGIVLGSVYVTCNNLDESQALCDKQLEYCSDPPPCRTLAPMAIWRSSSFPRDRHSRCTQVAWIRERQIFQNKLTHRARALQDSLDYVWIDTRCVDANNTTALNQALDSASMTVLCLPTRCREQ